MVSKSTLFGAASAATVLAATLPVAVSGAARDPEPRPDAQPPESGETPPEASETPPQFFRLTHANKTMARRIGIRIDGRIRPNDVQAYDALEGWAEVNAGRGKVRRVYGEIEPFWRDPPTVGKLSAPAPLPERTEEQHRATIDAAEAKRQRKAEKLRRLQK